MQIKIEIITCCFLLFSQLSHTNAQQDPFNVESLTPWCIIGFDSLERTPEQRVEMLKQMQFTSYGYNRGKGNLDNMIQEFNLAAENNIEISSVFLWLNAQRDSIGKLSASNNMLLHNLKKVDQKPAIWLSFSHNFFEELSQEASISFSVEMIEFIKSKTEALGCSLALYNHHGWFGNPYNQIKILETLADDSITMVYNFHHAQAYVDEFAEIVIEMKPYLSFVNLNGVKKEGPQIITIGEGDHEFDMIKSLIDQGYKGPWGILGHIESEDVQEVLSRNLHGLKSFQY